MTIQTLREKYPKLTEEQLDDIREYAKTCSILSITGVYSKTGVICDGVGDIVDKNILFCETNPVPENQTNLFENAN